METIKKHIPIEAIHPSELILDEMKARGMQNKELAERMGLKASNLSRLIRTKETITSNMALRLENALGIPAEYWMRLQVAYDRDVEVISQREEEEQNAIRIERLLSSTINLKILFKKLSLDSYTFLTDKIKELYQLFHVSNVEGLISLSTAQGCFKKSESLTTEEKNIITWILLARLVCIQSTDSLSEYKKENEVLAAREIAQKANMQTITEKGIKEIFQNYGIGYSVVEKLEKTPIDAYSTIIDCHPFIVVSHRRDNMDMLVFDVLHECGHINKHLTDNTAIVSYNQNMEDTPGIELEANKFARDILIPPSVWEKITRGKSKSVSVYSTIKAVTDRAKENGISPTIAAWRYKYETGVYKIPGYKSDSIR